MIDTNLPLRLLQKRALRIVKNTDYVAHSEPITKKYRSEPRPKPRVIRLAHEHSTTELFKAIQFCYSNLGFILITLASIVSFAPP